MERIVWSYLPNTQIHSYLKTPQIIWRALGGKSEVCCSQPLPRILPRLPRAPGKSAAVFPGPFSCAFLQMYRCTRGGGAWLLLNGILRLFPFAWSFLALWAFSYQHWGAAVCTSAYGGLAASAGPAEGWPVASTALQALGAKERCGRTHGIHQQFRGVQDAPVAMQPSPPSSLRLLVMEH